MGNLAVLAESVRFNPDIVLNVSDLGGEDHFHYEEATDTYTYKDDLSVVVSGAVACSLCADADQVEEFKGFLEQTAQEAGFQGHRQ